MKPHATAAALVGAALLSAAAAVAQTPATTPGRAMNGALIRTTVASTNVPAPVPITYYLPKNYDANRAERYPLLIQLHGGGGSNKDMESFRALSVGGGMGGLLDQAIENGLVAPMVSVMPSAGRAFYMNFRDGSQKWEDFVMKDFGVRPLGETQEQGTGLQLAPALLSGRFLTPVRGHSWHILT